MDDNFKMALEAALEWDNAEIEVFKNIRDNHPRRLAKYMAQRNEAFDADLAKTASQYMVDPDQLRQAMVDHRMKAATVAVINGVSFVGFGPRFR